MKNRLLLSAAFFAAAGVGKATAQTAPWKFAVLSDTQWVQAGGASAPIDDGKSPASFPASMIQQIDQEFLRQGVKFVIAVGDTIDGNKQIEIQARSLYSQDLYNAGVGFFPVRGNHEAGGNDTGMYFASYFPQTVNGGANNQTPSTYNVSTIVAGWPSSENLYDTQATLQSTLTSTFPPPAKTNQAAFTVGSNFSYPAANGTGNQLGSTPGDGLSYSFDYNNMRFVLVDQFVNGSTNNSTITAQQSWLTSRLADTARPLQSIVFAHKNLLGGSHKDNLFGNQTSGTDPGDGTGTVPNATRQQTFDTFVKSLASNNVRLYVGGHDHHHKRSVVTSPLTPGASVQQVISQSDSNKFYTPSAPFSADETSIEEDLYEVGVYIYTVDGPRLTAEYFAVPANLPNPTGNDAFPATPVLTGNWTRQSTFGYSLNGQAFLVPEGASYTTVTDNTNKAINNATAYGESGFVGTTFQIVSGTNGSTKKTNDGRVLTKYVNTGFAPKAANTVSDIASVWGLADLTSLSTDTVKVTVSFDPATSGITNASSVVLGARDPKTGNWINAVDYNVTGSNKLRVDGNYQNAPNTLGTYGVDLADGVAYAVVNGNAREFAVIPTPTATLPWDFNSDGRVTSTDANTVNTAARTKSTDLRYDLNNDGRVDSADVRWLTQHYTNPNGQ